MKTFKIITVIIVLSTFLIPNNSFSQDYIKFKTGDSIHCKITNIKADTLFLQKTINNNTINTYITLNKVANYTFGIIESIKSNNDTSEFYSLTLQDGTGLMGKVISYNKNLIVFDDNNLGKIRIKPFSINNYEKEERNAMYLISLIDGNQMHAKIIQRRKTEIEFETETLGKVTVPISKIKKMQIVEGGKMENGKFQFPNPNNTRYLFAPSAFNLKEGEAYYQNVYFLMNSVNYGLSDHFSIGGGVIIPFAVYITPKVNFKISEKFYAGVGVIAGILPGSDAVGIAYGITTYGNDENNITVGLGYGFYNKGFADRPIITLNGMIRLSRKIALVTENWSIPFTRTEYDYHYDYNIPPTQTEVKEYDTFVSYGTRIMFGEKITIDIALVNGKYIFDIMPMGFPYVDFVFKFGK